jgi:acyl-coenzyme A thioesterase PaaI-like protein
MSNLSTHVRARIDRQRPRNFGLATLADNALGCAVHSRLPAGTGYSTLEVKLNFVRPVTTATGRIRCVAQVLSFG